MTRWFYRILPQRKLGWWSLGLILAMPLLFALGASFADTLYASVPSGRTILDDIMVRPGLALTMLAGIAAGISAFITGLLAITRQKERAILVYLSTAIGALLILFLAAEFTSPH